MLNSEIWQQLKLPKGEDLVIGKTSKKKELPIINPDNRRTYFTWDYAVSELSDVAFPLQLDLRDGKETLRLVESMVLEEASIYEDYLGAIVYGSLSRNQATSESDIDIIHIFETYNTFENFIPTSHFNRVQKSISSTFNDLYNVPIHDVGYFGYYVLTKDVLEHVEPDVILEHLPMLDRDSKVFVKEPSIKDSIHTKLKLQERKPKKAKKKKINTELPHQLNIDRFREAPWDRYRSQNGPRMLFGRMPLE